MDFFDRVKQATNPGTPFTEAEVFDKLRTGQKWLLRVQREKYTESQKPGFSGQNWTVDFVEKWSGFIDQMVVLEAMARNQYELIGCYMETGACDPESPVMCDYCAHLGDDLHKTDPVPDAPPVTHETQGQVTMLDVPVESNTEH